MPRQSDTPTSAAIPVSEETRLGRVAAASTPPPPKSAFRLVHSGTLALDARLALIRAAERSLDIQYYEIAADPTGRAFLGELQAAAARGVRVRLLVDDLYTGEQQTPLAGLAAFDKVEVRVFNPLPLRHGFWAQRLLASLAQIDRLQMRMHNKLLIADGAFAIAGGRNIADEYYGQSESSAYFDLDVLLAGPVVAEFAALFDLYWNSERVWPIGELSRTGIDIAQRQRDFKEFVGGTALPDAPRMRSDWLGYGRLGEEIERGRVQLHAGQARAVADLPQKAAEGPFVAADLWDAPGEMRRAFNGVTRAAEREIVVVTPYAVPGDAGVQRTQVNRARGVRIRFLTNSLASTDEPAAHSGYCRYRKRMLESGVELYELDPMPSERLDIAEMQGKPTLRIHAKAAIVDRRIVYLGSMNLDPRSLALNTETGVIIESADFAADVLRVVDDLIAFQAWQVSLDEAGELQWSAGDATPSLDAEPRTSPWERLRLLMFLALVPEDVL